jgi:GT2 family glycosyltransferase
LCSPQRGTQNWLFSPPDIVEIALQFGRVHFERDGDLANKASIEEAAGQVLWRIGFDRLKVFFANPQIGSQSGQVHALPHSLSTQLLAYGNHIPACVFGFLGKAIILHSVQEYRTKTIAVIVVNWNRCELLRACLRSLECQTGKPFEVVLVDNGSNDQSVQMAQNEFGSAIKFKLRIIRNQENRGFCAANNQGFEAAAEADLIALLNNDAEAEPGWIEQLCGAFDSANVGMAASKILVYEDPTRIDKAGHLIYPDGQNRGRGTGQTDRGQFDTIEEVLWPDGCAAMYRREMLDEIGGFDEDFFAYADDAELGLRGRIAGWKCLYIPGAVVRHHRGASLGVRSARRLELIERNRILLAAKLFPWSLLWLNGVYTLARVGAGILAAASGKGEVSRFPGWKGKLRVATALLRGVFSAMLMLPKMLAKRRQTQRFRKLTSREVRQLILSNRISLRELSQHAN